MKLWELASFWRPYTSTWLQVSHVFEMEPTVLWLYLAYFIGMLSLQQFCSQSIFLAKKTLINLKAVSLLGHRTPNPWILWKLSRFLKYLLGAYGVNFQSTCVTIFVSADMKTLILWKWKLMFELLQKERKTLCGTRTWVFQISCLGSTLSFQTKSEDFKPNNFVRKVGKTI
jgi:hypothetical protein